MSKSYRSELLTPVSSNEPPTLDFAASLMVLFSCKTKRLQSPTSRSMRPCRKHAGKNDSYDDNHIEDLLCKSSTTLSQMTDHH